MKQFIASLYLCFVCSLVFGAEKLVVGVPESNMYPLYQGKGDMYKGFCRDVLDLFAKEYGYSFEYRPLPIKRLFLYLKQGKVDIKFPDDPELQPPSEGVVQIFYSKPVVTVTQGVMIPKGKPTAIKSVSLVSGWVVEESILPKEITRQEVPTIESAVNSVLAGHADGLWVNLQAGQYVLKQMGKNGELVFNSKMPMMSFRYALSSRDKKIVESFDLFLLKYAKQIADLKTKYELAVLVNGQL